MPYLTMTGGGASSPDRYPSLGNRGRSHEKERGCDGERREPVVAGEGRVSVLRAAVKVATKGNEGGWLGEGTAHRCCALR
ncbi:hypothetical protein GCM10022402_31970 [Salinactinospora qingdaonensis]|uniref:Uncharacterized protein n=1 Tax=Salinactinospora qingdaonensis TaxID=702744 RepID=A0ABP7FXM2_9ACTN